MRKLILALSICCSLKAFAIEQQPVEMQGSSSVVKQKKQNKENFLLKEEKFSAHLKDIDYDGLEKHIHYKFENRELLKDALYPMLHQKLKAKKRKFEHLEFLGDSVLGLITKERLVSLFPNENEGILTQLYNLLTKNRTLSKIYFRNLALEPYIPFPEKKSCKVCDLVEALIGGIYLDNSVNGFRNAEKFVMRILDDHVLEKKIRKISLNKDITLGPSILPSLDKTIRIVCTPERLKSDNPKTLLHEILSGTWIDTPTYNDVSVIINGDGLPRFSVTVSGAQIGNILQGEGDRIQEAEEDAARKAINFLAKEELLPEKNGRIVNKAAGVRLEDIPDVLIYKWKLKQVASEKFIETQIKFKGEVIGKGVGGSKSQSKDKAIHQACLYFKENPIFQEDRQQKNYRSLLKEFFKLVGVSDYKIEEPIPYQDDFYKIESEGVVVSDIDSHEAEAREQAAKEAFLFLRRESNAHDSSLLKLFLMLEGLDRCEINRTPYKTFIYQVLDEESKVLGKGIGLTTSEAKEDAAKKAFLRLKQIEEEKAKYPEELKRYEKTLEEQPPKSVKPKGKANTFRKSPAQLVTKSSSGKKIPKKQVKKPVEPKENQED